MKKLITLLMICLMAVVVTAPPAPYLVYGQVDWNDQLLSGTRLEITNVNTGVTETVVTNGDGYWQFDAGNFVVPGQTIKVKAMDGCGTGDVCEKSIVVGSTGIEDFAVIDLALTGELVCAPTPCPSCSSGGSSSCGSGGVFYKATQELCDKDFPCATKTCSEEKPCPTCPIVEPVVCEDCEACTACEECTEQPEGDILWIKILQMLGLVGIGGTGSYYWKKREGVTKTTKGVSIKSITNDKGETKIVHKHHGIRGYHSPYTSHREAHEKHPRNMVNPLYKKDIKGVWRYSE